MINTLLTSFRLSHAYGVNTLIYRLRALPVIKNILPADLYKNKELKLIANAITALYRVIFAFVKKFLYLGFMVMLPATMAPGDEVQNFITIVFYLTFIGAFENTDMFNPTKEKYYTVVLMRTDARSYVLSSYLWFMLKNFVTFIPASLVLGSITGLSVWACLTLPVFVIAVKLIGSSIMLAIFEKKDIALSENSGKFVWIVILIGGSLAYGMVFLQLPVTVPVFYICSMAALVVSVFSFRYIWCNKAYNRLCKKLLTMNKIIFNAAETSRKRQQKTYLSSITNNEIHTGKKEGYEYFNEVFTQRHKKLLTNSAKQIAGIFLIALAAWIVLTRVNDLAYQATNKLMLTFLPYFVFIMYIFNRGSVIAQAMFMDCDHSMLVYRFYRQPATIINLFKERLKTSIKINMIPAIVIAVGLPLLLFITGGTNNPLNYLLLFISILSMAVFFSVHHLVLYYLLQPYNVHMEAKSSLYSIANVVTYMICYVFIRIQAPTVIFASLIILFSVVYICAALFLVYKFAPRTFKLK